ncbi:MAG: hypothetical protein GY861_18200 [bacterium]|nr:hypothetical protein [bacterium]
MIPIQQIANDTLIANRRQSYEVKSWHASKLGKCLRGIYLDRLGIEPDKPFDPRTLGVFSAGTLFEDWYVSLLKAPGLTIETQVRVKDDDLNVSGYIDFIAEYKGEKRVYEIKTKHTKSFWHMKKAGVGAMKQHQYQLWIYLYLTQIKEGSVIYISKDDAAVLEYPISLDDEELRDEVLGQLKILNECWKNGTFPPMAEPSSWQSKYCRHHKTCREIEKAEFKTVDAFLKSRETTI